MFLLSSFDTNRSQVYVYVLKQLCLFMVPNARQ